LGYIADSIGVDSAFITAGIALIIISLLFNRKNVRES